MLFRDRTEAGKKLAEKIFQRFSEFQKKSRVIVLALPRGGVPVAYEIARKLEIPLDLIVAHKLGAPGNEELAIGAVAEDGSVFVDPDFIYRVSKDYVKKETQRQLFEIQKRIEKYRGGKSLPDLKGEIVFLVDDGIATGNTMHAAIAMVKKARAAKIIVAVPVLPPDTLKRLEKEIDAVIFLATPQPFLAIGRFYENFPQLEDEEVRGYLLASTRD